MAENKSFNDSEHALFESNEPVLFKNILCTAEGSNGWKLLNWSFDDFTDKFGDAKLPFRVGKNVYTTHPQWEVETPTEYITMKEFLLHASEANDSSEWLYFDYKRINDWFKDKKEILDSFNWHQFEIPFDASDSTIWIGSKGAHTNCHQDTYGCNLVAQTHGRKLWLLFSPNCSSSMQPTRIPYEESTIYSKYNFFTPSKLEIEAIKKMPGTTKMVILEPRDVLFVPKGWWHYVESLETSLSVNVWIPLKEDCNSRLKETLVHLVINTIGDGLPKAVDQPDSNLLECVELVRNSLKECNTFKKEEESSCKQKKVVLNDTDLLQPIKLKYPNHVKLLSDLTSKNIDDYIKKNNHFKDNTSDDQTAELFESAELSTLNIIETIVDAYCHPTIVSQVSNILTNKFLNR